MLTADAQAHNVVQANARSDAIAAAIRSRLDSSDVTLLDYGCGPGHVGLRLVGDVRHLVLADADHAALGAAREAVGLRGLARQVEVRELDLTRSVPVDLRVDVVVSSLSWHHIRDLDALVTALPLIAPGGRLLVADLDADGGAYHADEPEFDGHHGFDRGALGALLEAHGYGDIGSRDVWRGTRWTSAGLVSAGVFMLEADLPGRGRRGRPDARAWRHGPR